MSKLAELNDTTREGGRFFELCDRFYALFGQAGYERRAPSTDVKAMWRTLDRSVQMGIEQNLEVAIHILEQAQQAGYKLLGDKRLVWLALKQLKLKPSADAFSYISDGDVVEIYGLNGVQIFRSFEYMAVSSYSIEDVLLNTFEDLWERPGDINQRIWDECTQLITEGRSVMKMTYPLHRATEKRSLRKNSIECEFLYASPVFDEANQPVAVMVTAQARSV